MKNNKLICVILALLVCLSIAVSVSATTEGNVLTFSLVPSAGTSEGPSTVYTIGETFTITVNMDDPADVQFATADVAYDAEVFELVSSKALMDIVTIGGKVGTARIMIGDMTKALNGTSDPITATGAVVELTFKVLDTSADVETAITLSVSKNNTVDKDGVNAKKSETLTICEDVKLAINVPGANHVCDKDNLVEWNAKEATCCEAGKEADLCCPICNAVITEGAEIAKLDHAWDEGTVTLEPTCTEKGEMTYKCTNEECACEDNVKVEEIEELGHDWADATCTAPKTCNTCGETEGEALGHTGKLVYTDKEASCGEDGFGHFVCDVCGVTYEATIEATHELVEVEVAAVAATCTTDGNTAGTKCATCGRLVTAEVIPATGHDIVVDEGKAATCTEDGLTAGEHCTKCDYKVEQEVIKCAGEHIYDDGVIAVMPSCSEMGSRKYTCQVCGESYISENAEPATGAHSWSGWTVTKEATKKESGVQERTCSVCELVESEEIPQIEKSNNTVLIIVIIVVVVLAGGGVAAYFILKNKKK